MTEPALMVEQPYPAVILDAAMSVSEAIERLALHGFWSDSSRPEVRARIERLAAARRITFEAAADSLSRSPVGLSLRIRRQWVAQILWYVKPVEEVLYRCADSDPNMSLLNALSLHEYQSSAANVFGIEAAEPPRAEPIKKLGRASRGPNRSGAAPAPPPPPAAGRIDAAPGDAPFSGAAAGGSAPDRISRSPASGAPVPTPTAPQTVSAWPRLDAPDFVAATVPFDVTVGLSATARPSVAGAPVSFTALAGQSTLDVEIELTADGLDAPEGWNRTLSVAIDDPTAGTVRFTLVGREPDASQQTRLTTLNIRYVVNGEVCGTAVRALIIGGASETAAPIGPPYGSAWSEQPVIATAVALGASASPVDLTIELLKADNNPTNGRYQCRLATPHAVRCGITALGPFDIDLGQDARTFASVIVRDIRSFAGDPLVDNMLQSWGDAIAATLPAPVFDALRRVAAVTAPALPTVLLVSADPYVPWELMRIDPPLTATHPPYLGAQTVLGRWLRASGADVAVPGSNSVGVVAVKPAVQPPAAIRVRHMAVMAGMYGGASGLRQLPEAEKEAAAIASTYDAVQLAASTSDIKRLLDAALTHRFQQIGGADAVHFAGHGDVDTSIPDGAMLMLTEGRPLPSILFRSAKYGGAQQPLVFFNACMIGVGGELLGDMGGFPGNCLRGGFGGVLGALWEVDDAVAAEFAREFWHRALPPDGSAAPSVGEVLQTLRARYDATVPVHTWLAYVYYGHPRLTLTRANADS